MSDPADWQMILGRPVSLAPKCFWSVDLQVRVHYEKPDGLVPGGEGDFFFVDRHVRPRPRADDFLPSRDMRGMDESTEGCAVSAASLPRAPGSPHGGELSDSRRGRTAHQRDWDFLVEARDTMLARAGLEANSPVKDKVNALAAAFADGSYLLGAKAPFTRGFHPVDVLLHGQHCTGQSSALAALCHTLGVPARTLNFAGHSVCEVRLGGHWLLFENQVDRIEAGRSYMEEVADPSVSRLTPKRAEWYHWLMNGAGERHFVVTKGKWPNPVETAPFNLGAQRWWRFNGAGAGATHRMLAAGGGHGFTLPLCPDTARALYPEEPRHVFKYNAGEPCRVTLNLPHSWFLAPLRLAGPSRVRKVFWLGSLAGATRVSAFLGAAPGRMWRLHAPFDAAWQVIVNGQRFALSDRAMEARFVHHGFEICLPLDCLREGGLNQVEFGCERDNREEVWLSLHADVLDPYVPPIEKPVEVGVDAGEVIGVHVADTYAFHIPV